MWHYSFSNGNIKTKSTSWQDSHVHECTILMWKVKMWNKGWLSCIGPYGNSACTKIEISSLNILEGSLKLFA